MFQKEIAYLGYQEKDGAFKSVWMISIETY